jgi:hypothetical protein
MKAGAMEAAGFDLGLIPENDKKLGKLRHFLEPKADKVRIKSSYSWNLP